MNKGSSFNEYIRQTILHNWNQNALTDYQGQTLQFHDVARKIEKLHILFENSGQFFMSLMLSRYTTS